MYAYLLGRWRLCFILGSTLVLSLAAPIGCNGKDQRSVTISASKHAYLVGEPVVLQISFKNLGDANLSVDEYWERYYEPPIHCYISPDGVEFHRFRFGLKTVEAKPKPQRVLKHGDTWKYQLRLFYSLVPPSRLAFDKPGTYWIKTGDQASTLNNWSAESNVISVRIEEPNGDDAKVWQELNEPSRLAIVLFESADERKKDIVMKLAKLLRTYPASGYAPALRHALAKIYFHERYGLPEKDREDLAVTLGIADVDALADERLEVSRRGEPEKPATVDQALVALNKLGVRVDAEPELKSKTLRRFQTGFTLRVEMRSLSDELEATWERRGDGYYLVPFDPYTSRRVKIKP